jgi:hypothetical protein
MAENAGTGLPRCETTRQPTTKSKREQLQAIVDAARQLLLAAEMMQSKGLPGWQYALDLEAELGGREATNEWLGRVVRTMNLEQRNAMRWLIMDTQRAMLAGLAEPAGLRDLYLNLDHASLAEKRRVQQIAASRSEQLGVQADLYVDLAEQVLRENDPGLSGKVLNGLLSQKLADRSIPQRSTASLYKYFDLARKRLSD